MKKERLYPVEMESTGYYYFMAESAELADKLIYILKDRKCPRDHRKAIEYLVYNKLTTIPCFRFMDMPPFEKAMLVANGVHCTVFLCDNGLSITGYDAITERHAEVIMNAYEGTKGVYYHRYLVSSDSLSTTKDGSLRKAVAYYRNKGLL